MQHVQLKLILPQLQKSVFELWHCNTDTWWIIFWISLNKEIHKNRHFSIMSLLINRLLLQNQVKHRNRSVRAIITVRQHLLIFSFYLLHLNKWSEWKIWFSQQSKQSTPEYKMTPQACDHTMPSWTTSFHLSLYSSSLKINAWTKQDLTSQ